MKRKQNNGRTAKTLGVCLSPAQSEFVRSRARQAGISVSRYVQCLAEYDRAKNILADALTVGLTA
jgi:hypothetical protein